SVFLFLFHCTPSFSPLFLYTTLFRSRIQRVVRPILSGHPEEGRRAARVGPEVRGGAEVPVARRVVLQQTRRGERPSDRPVVDVHGEHTLVIRGRAVVVAIGDGDDLHVHALDDGG